jgi:hypothetical protein
LVKLLLLFFVFSNVAFSSDWKPLKAQGRLILDRIKEANLCLPKKENKLIKFCTGFTLSESDISFLGNLSRTGCELEVKRLGYKVIVNKRPKDLNEKE